MEYEDKQDTKNNLNEEENLIVLQLRNLSVGLGEESCIGFTQENSIENSLQELSLLICCNIGPCYDYATPTLKFILLPHVLLLIYHKTTMPYTCALMLYSLISAVHVCTMCTP